MLTFRLATINVFSFQKPLNYDSNVSDLVSIFKPFNLDLIAVQEIQNNKNWEQFCQHLSLSNFIYGSSEGEYFGNGIASRYPIISHSTTSSSFSCRGGTRFLLQCRLDGDHPFIQNRIFGVTHLDHLNEEDRLKQIKEFNPCKHNIDILMGDMNSLTRDDYSDEYFQENVLKTREKSNWEKPRFDVTELITDEWNYQDAFKLINPKLKDEQVSTCAYGTRIDYIYVHPHVNKEWNLSECSIINTQPATDHNAVFAEFTQISNKMN